MIASDSSYDPVVEIVSAAMQHTERALSASKKAEEIAENREFAAFEAYTEALAIALSRQRIVRYADLLQYEKFIELIDTFAVRKVMREFKARYKEIRPTKEGVKAREELIIEAIQAAKALIPHENVEERLEEYRRKRILAGEIEPSPDDADWLYAEREKFAAVVSPYDEALEKIRVRDAAAQ